MRLDGGAWIPSASPKVYSGLGDGPHTFDVRATDAAGNADLSPASFAWTVDTAAPNTTITGNPANPTNTTGATFSFTSSEGSSTFECRLDGGGWGTCTAPSFYGSLAEASHTFQVRATDAAANTDATPATFIWSIDAYDPPDRLDDLACECGARPAHDPAREQLGGRRLRPRVGRLPALARRCRHLDGDPRELDTTLVADGNLGPARDDLRPGGQRHDLERDHCRGGQHAAEHDHHLAARRPDERHRRIVRLLFRGWRDVRGSPRRRRLDPEREPEGLQRPRRGLHTFQVRATDQAGNPDPTPDTFTWTVDTTAPNTNITSQPADPTNATGASFAFNSTEGRIELRGSPRRRRLERERKPEDLQRPDRGSRSFQVRATDPAGNQDATQASYTWTIDTTAPNSSFTSTPADPSSDTTPTFGFASTEAPATYEVNLDSGGWVSASTPLTISPALSDGSHTLQLQRVTSSATRTRPRPPTRGSSTTRTRRLRHGPRRRRRHRRHGLAHEQLGRCGQRRRRSRSRSRFPGWHEHLDEQAASWNTAVELDGDYDLRVVTTDNAGNSFTSATITVTVDNTVPALSVNVANPVNAATSIDTAGRDCHRRG